MSEENQIPKVGELWRCKDTNIFYWITRIHEKTIIDGVERTGITFHYLGPLNRYITTREGFCFLDTFKEKMNCYKVEQGSNQELFKYGVGGDE
jgi:hypothetical protein